MFRHLSLRSLGKKRSVAGIPIASRGGLVDNRRPMNATTRRITILLFLAACCVLFDQGTKRIATALLEGKPGRSFLFGTVRFVYAENEGAFLGIGSGLPDAARNALVVSTVVMVLCVFWLALRSARTSLVSAIPFALVAAGGASNLIDRALNDGRVIDFMVVGAFGLRTGVFNVADMAITTGALLLLALAFKERGRSHPPEKAG